LIDALSKPFEEKYDCVVVVTKAGSGEALGLCRLGEVDLVMVHAPETEEKLVADGYGIDRCAVMHNDFVIAGPKADPAGIRGVENAAEAYGKIAETESLFFSRSDNSGTHKKEMSIWNEAGIMPSGEWYRETGKFMGATLKIASEEGGYFMTDRSTYIAMRGDIDLEILSEGDPDLVNHYCAIAVNPEEYPNVNYDLAKAFIEYITSPEGQAIIRDFGKEEFGEELYRPDAAVVANFADFNASNAGEGETISSGYKYGSAVGSGFKGRDTSYETRPPYIVTGVGPVDDEPCWYCPEVDAPYAPTFEVLDTDAAKGRYYTMTKTITLKDLVEFHGHDCEGLFHAACMCKLAMDELFPNGVYDRTNMRGMAGESPCFCDVVMYLTGGRIRHGTFDMDPRLGHSIIIQRIDTGEAVMVSWRPGVNCVPISKVNPEPYELWSAYPQPKTPVGKHITWKPEVSSDRLIELKTKLEKYEISPEELTELRWLQVQHVEEILTHPIEESYQIKYLPDFRWEAPGYDSIIRRNDIMFKNYPQMYSPSAATEAEWLQQKAPDLHEISAGADATES